MIRAGRQVVTRGEIAALHGLSERTARSRRPWAQPGHPAPVRAPAGRTAGLWDAEQARAWAAGKPVPALPEHDDPGDLLDMGEAAQMAGLDPGTWDRYYLRNRGLVPPPDATPGEIPHWRRDTVAHWMANRPGRGSANRKITDAMRAQADQLLAAGAAEGRRVTVRELAAAVGVAIATADKLIKTSTVELPPARRGGSSRTPATEQA